MPSNAIFYVDPDQDHDIKLKEEARYYDMGGFILLITVKTTIDRIKLYGKDTYDCRIMGDGKMQHWGIKFGQYPPATITIRCQ